MFNFLVKTALMFIKIIGTLILGFFLLIFSLKGVEIIMAKTYTLPALTKQKLEVYNECISFLKGYPQYSQIKIVGGGGVEVNEEGYYILDSPYGREKVKGYFSDEEIVKIEKIASLLKKVSCFSTAKDNDMILFRIRQRFIRPSAPGVLYSLSGRDPNNIDAQALNYNKPFIKIAGNWYASRGLYVSWNRKTNERGIDPLPPTLFDHSLDKSALEGDIPYR